MRLLGVLSARQRLLFDPVLKYVPDQGAGERVSSRLVMAHLERVSRPDAANTLILDLRVGLFEKQAIRAPLLTPPDFRFGAFSVVPHEFAGETIARGRDSLAALDAIPGFERPSFVSASPWGVPAFFMTASPRGELAWNRFREGRVRVDAFWGRGRDTDIRLGGEYVRQRVEKFTRLEAFRSVAAGAPPPALAVFSPFQAAGYGELLHRLSDLTLSVGVRVDAFNPRAPVDTGSLATAVAVSPRFAVSTSLKGATVVGSYGRFAQPPDFQYLTDIAFDDTLRTGRFRRGNPSLGFETSTQYELQVRFRPTTTTGIRVGVFVKRLDGLVASVPVGLEIDSAVLGNADFGDVRGLELTLQQDFVAGIGARLTYVLQKAEATASDALQLYRRLRISPVGDTVVPAPVAFPLDFDRRHSVIFVGRARVPEGAGAVLRGLETGVVARWSSGLPFSRTTPTGDSLIGLPNSDRLPFHFRVDLLVRRVLHLGGLDLGFYVDVRNLTNRRNVIAVRRDTGSPTVGEPQVQAAAEAAYAANPQPIPYESQRYRSFADMNGDGLISGRDELLPLFEGAARDFLQPIFAFGPPRLIRIGAQIGF